LNDKVLVPITGSSWDDEALVSYQDALPGYEVLGFTGSWQNTDALHCRTMGITDSLMLYIEHTPLSGSQTNHTGYDVEAKIIPYSGEDLIFESTGVYWKVEGGDWNFIEMEPTRDNNYYATIPAQEDNTEVYYYIQAADESGRTETHPYIGESMAHTFTAFSDNNPPEIINLDGPTTGSPGIEYTYCIETFDPDGDLIYVFWDWDDGETSGWLGPYASGEEICANHTWDSRGTYNIQVKIKDIINAESDWTELAVEVPRSRLLINSLFLRLLEHFAILGRLIFGII
jgi:hypothetical protein